MKQLAISNLRFYFQILDDWDKNRAPLILTSATFSDDEVPTRRVMSESNERGSIACSPESDLYDIRSNSLDSARNRRISAAFERLLS